MSANSMSGGSPLARSRKAMARAEAKRCPKCDRKSALRTVLVPGAVVTGCRYEDCGYEKATDLNP